MKRILLAMTLVLFFVCKEGWAEENKASFAVTMIVAKQKLRGDEIDNEEAERDREAAYKIVMQQFKSRCRFFDEERHKQQVAEFYKKNPNADPTDLQNHLKMLELPTTLILMFECDVKSIQDETFPIAWHNARMNVKVVDKGVSAEIYSFQQMESSNPPRVLVPINSSNVDDWKRNRSSREKAIECLTKEISVKVFAEMDSKLERIQAFDFVAMNLTAEGKKNLLSILDEIKRAGASVSNIKDSTNQGISAKINFKTGIQKFMDDLSVRMQKKSALANMVCDMDGNMIKVYAAKEDNSVPQGDERFKGKVVLSQDVIRIKELEIPDDKTTRSNLVALKDTLQENLQERIDIFDAAQLWENLKNDSQRLKDFALINPGDFIARKQGLQTHIVYYWGKTNFKDVSNIGRYCFAEIGVRVVETISGRELALFSLNSADEFGRGVQVNRDEEAARKTALKELAEKASKKVVEKLLREDPTKFRIPDPSEKVEVKAVRLEPREIDKMSKVFISMQNDKEIKIEDQQNGTSFLTYQVTFPAKKGNSQISFRAILQEFLVNEGLGKLKIESEQGRLLISPKDEESD